MPEEGLSDIRINCNDEEELAHAIINLYYDESRWHMISIAGLDYVERNYSINSLIPTLKGILEKE